MKKEKFLDKVIKKNFNNELEHVLEQKDFDVQTDKSHPSYDQYEYTYPKDMMFVLNEDVIISDNNGEHLMDTCVFECTQDSFMYRINNSLTDFLPHNKRQNCIYCSK